MDPTNGNGHEPEGQEGQEQSTQRMVCGVVVFLAPNGAGIVVQPIKPDEAAVERLATFLDLKTMATEMMMQQMAVTTEQMLMAGQMARARQQQVKRGSLHVPGLDNFRGLFNRRH